MKYISLLLGASSLISPIFAQTWTACNPTNATGPTCPTDPALSMNHTFIFNQSSTVTDAFNITAGSLGYDSTSGTSFTVAKKGDSPTIQSKFYIFFGVVSIVMKAAPGTGIISTLTLESDDLDEIDWEIMGGDTQAETNYFGKGNHTTYDRAAYHAVPSDPRTNYHNYTVVWTADKIDWMIDSSVVRTLKYADALEGKNYPQTPMTVRIGIWAGGDSGNDNGTISWAGGVTDYTKGPYTMYVQKAEIQDYGSGAAYEYSDHTGDWQSIKSISGNSTVAETIVKGSTPTLSLAQKFAALPTTTKLAIYGGSAGAGVLLLAFAIFTCCRARRRGRREREAYNAEVKRKADEAYQDQMELREKGLGGWDKKEFDHQGDDALGGWGGSHVAPGTISSRDKDLESSVAVGAAFSTPTSAASAKLPNSSIRSVGNDFQFPPSRSNTNSSNNNGNMPRVTSPVARFQTPQLVSPVPQSPSRAWVGGGMSGGGGGGGSRNGGGNGYDGPFNNAPRNSGPPSRQPSFPFADGGNSQRPQQPREFPGTGFSGNGYSRF